MVFNLLQEKTNLPFVLNKKIQCAYARVNSSIKICESEKERKIIQNTTVYSSKIQTKNVIILIKLPWFHTNKNGQTI